MIFSLYGLVIAGEHSICERFAEGTGGGPIAILGGPPHHIAARPVFRSRTDKGEELIAAVLARYFAKSRLHSRYGRKLAGYMRERSLSADAAGGFIK